MSATKTRVAQPGMYDWVARHTSEVEHEVIAFHGETLELLRVAQACDAGYAALERQLAELTRQRDELLAAATELLAALGRIREAVQDRDTIVTVIYAEIEDEATKVIAYAEAAIANARGTVVQRDELLATLRMIADGQDDPAWMRMKARKAIAEVTA